MVDVDVEIDRFRLPSGTEAEIRRPSRWNGYVFVQPDLWDGPAEQVWEQWLSECGFASVRHSRLTRGWDLLAAQRDDRDARAAFEAQFGTPERGYVAVGASLGALTVRWLLEREDSAYLGGIAMDGGGGGALSPFECALDGAYALVTLLGLEEPLSASSEPEAASVGQSLVKRAAAAASDSRAIAFLDVAVALTMMPDWSDPASVRPTTAFEKRLSQRRAFIASLPLAYGIRAQVEQSIGGLFCGNSRVSYSRMVREAIGSSSLAEELAAAGSSLESVGVALEGGQRLQADPQLEMQVSGGAPISGAITAPLVVLRTIGDPAAVAAEESRYERSVGSAGTQQEVRFAWVDGPGHVNASISERAAAVRALLSKVETGEWAVDEPDELHELAVRAAASTSLDIVTTPSRLSHLAQPPVGRFVSFAPQPLLRDV